MREVVVVEGIGSHNLDVGWEVARTALLDWTAVGAARTARPVERPLQGRVLRVVLGHAPQLRVHHAVLGPSNRLARPAGQEAGHYQ